MSFTFASITLAASSAICGYLIFLAFTPPNPAQKDAWGKDILMRYQSQLTADISLAFLFLLWLYHTVLILFPPWESSILCPHPEQVSVKFITWNAYTASYITLILIAAPIRLLAYKQLGKSFTFNLAKPKCLVKTGLYAYTRHPSYPSLWACHIATFALVLRWGGAIGCWLPSWLVTWRPVELGGIILLCLVSMCALGVRVVQEEEMLRSEFGEEWETYAKKTKRFVPFII